MDRLAVAGWRWCGKERGQATVVAQRRVLPGKSIALMESEHWDERSALDVAYQSQSIRRSLCAIKLSPVLNMRVGGFHSLLPILRLETFNNKMTACHVLKMIDEQHVDCCARGSANDRQRLGCGLFGNNDAKTGRHCADESSDRRRSFINHPTAPDMSCRITERLAERGADGPVSTLAAVI